jgi:hypothetical protein
MFLKYGPEITAHMTVIRVNAGTTMFVSVVNAALAILLGTFIGVFMIYPPYDVAYEIPT